MKKFISGTLILLFTILVTSCLDVEYKIKLKTDGSGTIEEKVMMSASVVEMLSSFSAMDDSSESEPFSLFDEEELKQEAAEIGEGVTYLSGEAIEDNGASGYLAMFEFKDINKIKIEQDPSDKIPAAGMMTDPDKKKEEFTFNFEKGEPAVLTIFLPKEIKKELAEETEEIIVEDAEYEEEDTSSTQDFGEELFELFRDFRIKIEIELDGDLVETDASFVEGSNVTLFEMDFSKLFENPERLEEFKKLSPESLEETSELLKDLPGFKIEMKEIIVIKFE